MCESKSKIKLFEKHKVRAAWDEEAEKWWFSVVDTRHVVTLTIFRYLYYNSEVLAKLQFCKNNR